MIESITDCFPRQERLGGSQQQFRSGEAATAWSTEEDMAPRAAEELKEQLSGSALAVKLPFLVDDQASTTAKGQIRPSPLHDYKQAVAKAS